MFLLLPFDGAKNALTPCPSPLAKSAPGEGRVLYYSEGKI